MLLYCTRVRMIVGLSACGCAGTCACVGVCVSPSLSLSLSLSLSRPPVCPSVHAPNSCPCLTCRSYLMSRALRRRAVGRGAVQCGVVRAVCSGGPCVVRRRVEEVEGLLGEGCVSYSLNTTNLRSCISSPLLSTFLAPPESTTHVPYLDACGMLRLCAALCRLPMRTGFGRSTRECLRAVPSCVPAGCIASDRGRVVL